MSQGNPYSRAIQVKQSNILRSFCSPCTRHEDWRILLACAWEGYARFCLRRQGREAQNKDTDKAHLDQAARCLEEALGVYLPGSEESLAATIELAAVMLEKGQVDTASALMESARAKRLPESEDGADG